MGATGGRESMSSCVWRLVKLVPLIMHLNEFKIWLLVVIVVEIKKYVWIVCEECVCKIYGSMRNMEVKYSKYMSL